MRRGVGIGGIKKGNDTKNRMKETVGSELNSFQTEAMSQKMVFFQKSLEEFAKNHKEDINKDPQFRFHFHQMCLKIGVDPLASSKGFWAKLLGVGDFYYELSVQIVEVCLKTKDQNGGLIELDDLTNRIIEIRSKNSQKISKNDIVQAIKSIKPLGNGFTILKIGNKEIVQSVPCELSRDHTIVLTMDSLMKELSWTTDRVDSTLNLLLQEGMAWIDSVDNTFWFPGLIQV
eukprot:gene2812-4220_t